MRKELCGMNRKKPMPRYYGKNVAQHAQKRFLKRKAMEANQEERQERPAAGAEQAERTN